MRILLRIAALAVLTGLLPSQPVVREQVGPLPSGGFLLNSGWKLTPAGRQVPVSTFPMSCLLSKNGQFLFVLNGGVAPPSISVIDVRTEKVVNRVPVDDAWLGLALNPQGDHLYVGGGSRAAVYEFAFSDGKLTPARTFTVVGAAERDARDFIGDLAFSPDGHTLYASDLYRDALITINPLTGRSIQSIPTGRRPYRILFHPDGKSFFVSSWADGTVTRYQASDGSAMGSVRLGPHPTDMVWRHTETGDAIYVAAANTNSVYSVVVPGNGEITRGATISVGFAVDQPLGMTPSALALTADSQTLFAVCSNANAVAQIDLSQERPVLAGFIPTGWYPTAVQALADGKLIVVNGRGPRSYPNPKGPSPANEVERAHQADNPEFEYVALIQKGTVSFIDRPSESQLVKYTEAAISNAPKAEAGKPALPEAIKHVIFIVKENRTYDQVLGDMKEGNGDASLVLFGENVTPNLHKIAREFVLLDNFYVNADVSADGHNWSTSAIANDYVEKLWPNSYGQRRKTYDYEGGEAAALPPAGYLWGNAHLAGVSIRNYGYWVTNKTAIPAGGEQIATVRDPQLAPSTDRGYRGFDLDYPDVSRAAEFIRELHGFEQSGQMPQLSFVRMGNDHTSGLEAGKIAPLSAAADNDYGVGLLVEAVSHSKFWADTAIFIVEDDAQNGPDHVDSHRSPAYVISPYTKRHTVDSTMYNTVSMLRTMELFLGMKPMTQFDANARVMSSVFQSDPNLETFSAEKPRIALDTRNPPRAGTHAHLDLRDADRVEDAEMNAELWQAIKGKPLPRY